MFNVLKSHRYFNFSDAGKSIVEAGVDLYKHYLFVQKGDLRFAENAKGKSYEEKQELFNKSLIKEAVAQSGLVFANGYDVEKIVRNPVVFSTMFQLISETLTNIIPSTILDQFGQFADVRMAGWGDNFRFEIPNPNLFVVSTFADGIRKGKPQRLYASEEYLTPKNHVITIQEDLYRILAGKVNWGEWITKISLSVQSKISTEVYDALHDSFDDLNANFQEATFDADTYVTLAERVEAANGGARVSVWGTRAALSKVIPADAFKNSGDLGLSEEYNRIGYLGQFRGVNSFLINQRVDTNDAGFNFSISNDRVYLVAMGVDRPIKVGFEGEALIFQNTNSANADLTQDYTFQQKWDTKVITSSRYGIVKVS
jgi:hypothetical protein